MRGFRTGIEVVYHRKGEYYGDIGVVIGIDDTHTHPYQVRWIKGKHKEGSVYRYTNKHIKPYRGKGGETYRLLKHFDIFDILAEEPCREELVIYVDLIGYMKIDHDNFAWFLVIANEQNDWLSWLQEHDFIEQEERYYEVGDMFKVFGKNASMWCLLTYVEGGRIALINIEAGGRLNTFNLTSQDGKTTTSGMKYLTGGDEWDYIVGGVRGWAHEIT